MLEIGNIAPPFALPDADMKMTDLSQFQGKQNIVIYFYPKDDTPGCTVEAIDFTNLSDDFTEAQTVVFGVSRDDCGSHAAFRDKHGLAVTLLADTDGEVCKKYGVWQEKEKDGVKKWGILRSTFVIDKAGKIRLASYGVNPKGHAAEVLKFVNGLEA